jgi:hypothetical protein
MCVHASLPIESQFGDVLKAICRGRYLCKSRTPAGQRFSISALVLAEVLTS